MCNALNAGTPIFVMWLFLNHNKKQDIMDNTNTQNKNAEGFKITGNWDDQSKQLKEKFSQLTDSDLMFETGKEDDLLKRVETRLNKNREEVINIIKKGQPEKK
jgi:hypothetical protein